MKWPCEASDGLQETQIYSMYRHASSDQVVLLFIVPWYFTNAYLRHTQNSCHLTQRIALCGQQDNLAQNVIHQICCMLLPVTHGNRRKIDFEMPVIFSRQLALGVFLQYEPILVMKDSPLTCCLASLSLFRSGSRSSFPSLWPSLSSLIHIASDGE